MPPAVIEATTDYKTKSDHLEEFLDECCEREGSATVETAALFGRYKEWCDDFGEFPISVQTFTQGVEKKGYQRDRVGPERTRVWRGLRLYGSVCAPNPATAAAVATNMTT
jgi:phage/plasmid-associated DNA primase